MTEARVRNAAIVDVSTGGHPKTMSEVLSVGQSVGQSVD
jgi:hypothetical protein